MFQYNTSCQRAPSPVDILQRILQLEGGIICQQEVQTTLIRQIIDILATFATDLATTLGAPGDGNTTSIFGLLDLIYDESAGVSCSLTYIDLTGASETTDLCGGLQAILTLIGDSGTSASVLGELNTISSDLTTLGVSLTDTLTSVEADLAGLGSSVSTILTDLTGLGTSVSTIITDLAGLGTSVSTIITDLVGISASLATIETDVGCSIPYTVGSVTSNLSLCEALSTILSLVTVASNSAAYTATALSLLLTPTQNSTALFEPIGRLASGAGISIGATATVTGLSNLYVIGANGLPLVLGQSACYSIGSATVTVTSTLTGYSVTNPSNEAVTINPGTFYYITSCPVPT